MFNRHAQGRSAGNGEGFVRPRKNFIPKAHSAPSEPATNPTLSASLRESIPQKPGAGASSASVSASRVRLGENGHWVSSSDHGGNFVNYLPQDEAIAAGFAAEEGGLDPVESQRVVDLLNRELSRLLKLKPKDFWRKVAMDASLHDFLDSFLQFRSRWYDFPHRGAKGLLAGVIVGELDLSRRVFMVLYRISSNRDPGAKAAESLNLKDHSALMQEKKLLDLPKLLNICSIYGLENENLTSSLVINALQSQPEIHNGLTALICHFMNIIHAMHQRCKSSLEALVSAKTHDDSGYDHLLSDFLEAMDFINDAVVSMDAFVSAYKPATVFFSCTIEMSYGNDELLFTLARLHDSLLPCLQRGFQIMCTVRDGLKKNSNNMVTDVAVSLKMLSSRIVKFGWKLLETCFLSNAVFDGSFILPAATRMFPAIVEDPGVRADILIQMFRDIHGGTLHVHEGQGGSFLQNIEKDYEVIKRLKILQDTGWIFLDDEQFSYVHAIASHPSKASAAPTPMAGGKLQSDEETALTESKISQIVDLFPDYGQGFLLACLEVYDQNPEEVIQRILEGTLHEDLRSLDTSLGEIPRSKASSSQKDKGKGKVSEFTSHASTEDSPLLGRFVRKTRHESPDQKILESRDGRDAEKTAELASRFEYDDEYDDSFDDLGLSVAESGLEVAESAGSKWNPFPSRPQFYVKDGKNYGYKVAGSVGVASQEEASMVHRAQREMIHGLGRGGNRGVGAEKKTVEMSEERDGEAGAGRGERGRARRGGGRGNNRRKDQAFKKHFSGLGGY